MPHILGILGTRTKNVNIAPTTSLTKNHIALSFPLSLFSHLQKTPLERANRLIGTWRQSKQDCSALYEYTGCSMYARNFSWIKMPGTKHDMPPFPFYSTVIQRPIHHPLSLLPFFTASSQPENSHLSKSVRGNIQIEKFPLFNFQPPSSPPTPLFISRDSSAQAWIGGGIWDMGGMAFAIDIFAAPPLLVDAAVVAV